MNLIWLHLKVQMLINHPGGNAKFREEFLAGDTGVGVSGM